MLHRFDAVARYETAYAQMIAKLEQVTAAKNLREQCTAMGGLNKLMTGQKLKKAHQTVGWHVAHDV